MNLRNAIKRKILSSKKSREKFLSQTKSTSLEFQITTWFGSGLIIPASGTWGTLGGLIFAILLLMITSPLVTLVCAIILTIIGFWATNKIETQLDDHDSSFIVIDEVVAIMFVLALLPTFTLTFLILAFAIFRIFDAVKPYPINWLDNNLSGATGVMLDDLMAALYTLLILWGLWGIYGLI